MGLYQFWQRVSQDQLFSSDVLIAAGGKFSTKTTKRITWFAARIAAIARISCDCESHQAQKHTVC